MAQHGDLICDFQNFIEFVADKNNGLSLMGHLSECIKKMGGFLGSKNRGGFVKNEELTLAVQQL